MIAFTIIRRNFWVGRYSVFQLLLLRCGCHDDRLSYSVVVNDLTQSHRGHSVEMSKTSLLWRGVCPNLAHAPLAHLDSRGCYDPFPVVSLQLRTAALLNDSSHTQCLIRVRPVKVKHRRSLNNGMHRAIRWSFSSDWVAESHDFRSSGIPAGLFRSRCSLALTASAYIRHPWHM